MTTLAPTQLWPVLLLGVLGNLLFRVEYLGVNVGLWVLTAAILWYRHQRLTGTGPGESERGLLVYGLVLAWSAAWRADPTLLALNAVGLVLVAALLPLAARRDSSPGLAGLTPAQVVQSVLGLVGRGAVGAAPTLLEALRRQPEGDEARRGWLGPLARGTVLALPLLLLFGALLGSADPVFGDFLTSLVRLDPDRLASHLVGTMIATWLGAAFLRGALPDATAAVLRPLVPRWRGLGAIEVGVTVGVVDLLFAAFVVFQLPYLFGGAAWVERTAGVTLAEYARRGFFELVALSALVLPSLLVLASQLDSGSRRATVAFRSLAGIQVALVLCIMGSAAHRMALYQQQFGLTSDRFFASAAMAGLAVTALWFSATILRGREAQFARGTLFSWGTWLLLLNLANPERVIVETNLRRYAAGRPFDAAYHSRLGPDAVPVLVAALPTLPPQEREQLQAELVKRLAADSTADWRGWSLARARARAAMKALPESLEGMP